MTTESETVVAETTITVTRSIKIGSDVAGGSELPETIEVHKFATTPAMAEAKLAIRKSQESRDGLWVAGEITIGCVRPCYAEELPQATEAAYDQVKARLLKEIPELLKSLNDLGS